MASGNMHGPVESPFENPCRWFKPWPTTKKAPHRGAFIVLWWAKAELNRRHMDFQSIALPAELPAQTPGGPYEIRTRDLLRDREAC